MDQIKPRMTSGMTWGLVIALLALAYILIVGLPSPEPETFSFHPPAMAGLLHVPGVAGNVGTTRVIVIVLSRLVDGVFCAFTRQMESTAAARDPDIRARIAESERWSDCHEADLWRSREDRFYGDP